MRSGRGSPACQRSGDSCLRHWLSAASRALEPQHSRVHRVQPSEPLTSQHIACRMQLQPRQS